MNFPNSANARWVWAVGVRSRHGFARFVRDFEVAGGGANTVTEAGLWITAEQRYRVWLDGHRLGDGPARHWPDRVPVDPYDLSALLTAGTHRIEVLVEHVGVDTWRAIAGPPGLWARLTWRDDQGEHTIETGVADDGIDTRVGDRINEAALHKWLVMAEPGFANPVPRIAPALGWEEQFDAKPGARRTGVCGAAPTGVGDAGVGGDRLVLVPSALDVNRPVLEPRSAPVMRDALITPRAVPRVEAVRSWPCHASMVDTTGYAKVGCFIRYSGEGDVLLGLSDPHSCSAWRSCDWTFDGEPILEDPEAAHGRRSWGGHAIHNVTLRAAHMPHALVGTPRQRPLPRAVISLISSRGLCVDPITTSRPGALTCVDPRRDQPVPWREAWFGIRNHSGAETTAVDDAWEPLPRSIMADTDVFAICHSDEPVNSPLTALVDAVTPCPEVDTLASLTHPLADGDDECWVHVPSISACDTRLLLDFGRVVMGNLCFEVEAACDGVVLDFHGFEHMAPDGTPHYANGLNNTLRYTCRAGRQHYESWTPRGLRYCWLTVRRPATAPVPADNRERDASSGQLVPRLATDPSHEAGDPWCPLRIGFIAVRDRTAAPPALAEMDLPADRLNRFWRVSLDTLAPCREDTFTDCPTHEQVMWVGDARTSSLSDQVLTGDTRVSRSSLVLAGRSMAATESPLVAGRVPVRRGRLLPAWAFLWMRWCRDYVLWTGDLATARDDLMPMLRHQADGMDHLRDGQGLFRKHDAWNFLDWAPIDGPEGSATSWNQALGTLGLRAAAELAAWLGDQADTRRFRQLADEYAEAMNAAMWDEHRGAYLDSIHADGTPSRALSVHAQAMPLWAGVPDAERAERCHFVMADDAAVRPQSPFVESLVLEALIESDVSCEAAALIPPTLERVWGRQIDLGAASFWEMDHRETARPTRSFCHAWSSAPIHLITRFIAGIQPTRPGFETVDVRPRVDLLSSLRCRVPTPLGPLALKWQSEAPSGWIAPQTRGVLEATVTVEAPRGFRVDLHPPPGMRLAGSQPGDALTLEPASGPQTLAIEPVPRQCPR